MAKAAADKMAPLEKSVADFVKKLDAADLPREGDVVIRFGDEKPVRVAMRPGGKSTIHRTTTEARPRLEISGDPERLREVLEGKKDPRMAFLEGQITVRGDIDYLQSVLRSLGLLS